MPKLGLMNNPQSDPLQEVRWMGENGFDFVDLTVEFPKAMKPDVGPLKEELAKHQMSAVGHTDPNLPYAYPVKGVMEACVDEMARCADIFARIGAKRMNIHPCYSCPPAMRSHRIPHNIKALKKINQVARDQGLELMLENYLHPFASVETFGEILNAIPTLKVHLDVGHAALQQKENLTGQFLRTFGDRVVHIHVSDNRYRNDDHMPLGAGEVNWREILGTIKRSGYDGFFTLEVFSREREYQLLSKKMFLEWWDEA